MGGSTDGARVSPTLAGGGVVNSVGEGVATGGLVSPVAWAVRVNANGKVNVHVGVNKRWFKRERSFPGEGRGEPGFL